MSYTKQSDICILTQPEYSSLFLDQSVYLAVGILSMISFLSSEKHLFSYGGQPGLDSSLM